MSRAGLVSKEVRGVKLVLEGDRVVAMADLMAAPFVPEHLTALLPRMCEIVAAHDVAVAKECDGYTLVAQHADDADAPPEDDIHPVMRTLLHLTAEQPLNARLVARVCKYEPGLIADLMLWNTEQEIAWRRARDEATASGDADEAAACEFERAHVEHTIGVIRKALHRVLR